MARAPTQKELAAFVVGHGIVDFVSGGKLSLMERNVLWKSIKKLGPPVARAAPRLGMTALQVGKQIALRHPVLTAGAVVYYTYKNREEIADLVEQGYDVIQPQVQQVGGMVEQGLQTLSDLGPPIALGGSRIARKKTKSAFNKAVSKGMSIVKGSTSYGKKGTINNAKKAFSAVTKVASAASKKKKAPKTGITRKIYLGVKGLFK
jgi:hypothetical protein